MQTSRSIKILFLLYLSARFITIATKRSSNLILGAVLPPLWAHHCQIPYIFRIRLIFFSATPDLLQQHHCSSLNSHDLSRSTKTWWGSLWPSLFFSISNFNCKSSIFYSFMYKTQWQHASPHSLKIYQKQSDNLPLGDISIYPYACIFPYIKHELAFQTNFSRCLVGRWQHWEWKSRESLIDIFIVKTRGVNVCFNCYFCIKLPPWFNSPCGYLTDTLLGCLCTWWFSGSTLSTKDGMGVGEHHLKSNQEKEPFSWKNLAARTLLEWQKLARKNYLSPMLWVDGWQKRDKGPRYIHQIKTVSWGTVAEVTNDKFSSPLWGHFKDPDYFFLKKRLNLNHMAAYYDTFTESFHTLCLLQNLLLISL